MGLSILMEHHIGTGWVLCYFILRLNLGGGFRLFFLPTPLNTEPIDARGAAASIFLTRPNKKLTC